MSTSSGALSGLTGKRNMQLVCGGLLIAAAIVLSGTLACAVPFAALAALAAISIDRRSGIVLMGTIWLANQAIGFAFLGYPLELECIGWGLMVGISALLGLFATRVAIGALHRFNAFIQACAAFLFAFCAYEGSLYAASVVTASSEAAFSWPVIKEVAAINAGSFAVLFCLYRALLAAGLLRRSILQAEGSFAGAKLRAGLASI